MYVRTANALAWLDTATLEPTTPPRTPRAAHASRPRVILARRAFDGRLGRYTAVRLVPRRDGSVVLEVAVANRDADARGPRWVLASDALTEPEAARWARLGFRATR